MEWDGALRNNNHWMRVVPTENWLQIACISFMYEYTTHMHHGEKDSRIANNPFICIPYLERKDIFYWIWPFLNLLRERSTTINTG